MELVKPTSIIDEEILSPLERSLTSDENCPLCNQVLPETSKPVISLEVGVVIHNGLFRRLTPSPLSLLQILLDHSPNIVTREVLIDQLYQLRPNDPPEIQIIDVYVSKIRSTLKGTGIDIVNSWGQGYSLKFRDLTNEEKSNLESKRDEELKLISEERNKREDAFKSQKFSLERNRDRKSKKERDRTKLTFEHDVGPTPKIDWVPLEQMIIDHIYQRELNERHVQDIALNFDWRYFSPPSIVKIGDSQYSVFDGQHRVEAARIRPEIDSVPCYITELSSIPDQAKAFIIMNKKRLGVTPVDIYWAAVAMGEEETLEIKNILDNLNLEIPPYLGYVSPKHVSSVNTLARTLSRDGKENLRDALEILKNAKPKENNAFPGKFIQAVSRMVTKYGDVLDHGIVKNILQEADYKEMNFMSSRIRIDEQVSSEIALFEIIRRAYNKVTDGKELN